MQINLSSRVIMAEIDAKIKAQGDKIRELKAAKSAKDVIEPEVKTLLALKAEFKVRRVERCEENDDCVYCSQPRGWTGSQEWQFLELLLLLLPRTRVPRWTARSRRRGTR